MDLETVYRCPGEAYDISRWVHLGRLASFYPACGDCPHRGDTATLSARRIRMLTVVQRQAGRANPPFHAEGISGVYLNEVGPELARRVGQALGTYLSHYDSDTAPRVVLANDGRPSTIELATTAADGLRWTGCSVADLGAATAPCLALAAERQEADGALLIGNPGGKQQEVGLTLWGRCGEPLSAPGELDSVRRLVDSPAPRPRRAFGGIEQIIAGDSYLAQLETHYHALRPLRFFVDTTSFALVEYIKRLTSKVALKIHFESRILQRLRPGEAHFGIWIDGDGERCRIVDERGEPVSVEALVVLFARESLAARQSVKIVLSESISQLAPTLNRLGVETFTAASNRQAIYNAVVQHQPDLAADEHGRIWFAGQSNCADALKVLTLLLTLLSRSDQPLSEHIASEIL
ncbi:MAG TPA: hypothetical protein VGY55_25365 [Pirellulales bacterium]|jgi:phosphomannomutase|nr:hypothetical protein [Pirellulales bacterium]